jgi:prophage antirepressor-like protein
MSSNSLPNLIEFSGAKIRLVGTPENPEWVAADVCAVLGIEKPHNVLRYFKDTERGMRIVDATPNNPQEMLTVTEPGLYRLIFKSRKPEADRFRTWVTHEVLPSLRQHGCFPPPQVQVSTTALVTLDPEQLYIHLGQQLHAALFNATQPRFDSIDEQFVEVRQRLDKVERRKLIAKKTQQRHLHILRRFYAGKCPCCHAERIVNDAGEKLMNCEFDHWERVSEVQASKTWAVCTKCNSKLRDSDWKANRRVKFESYQQTRVEFERGMRGEMLPGMDD